MYKLNFDLYKKLYLIRKAEMEIRNYYPENDMKTPMHMSMGEEAIVAGVCLALGQNSQVFGTYRSHGLYLAKTGETDKFFAEMYGKETGGAKGKAGSMHLSLPEAGMMGTSAIVSGIIPVGCGAAFANKTKKNNKISAIFFGDGAIDEGSFWESLNIACLMHLPVLFICQDNGFAVHTPGILRHGYKSIADIVSKFDCNVLKTETTDAEIIYNLTQKAIRQIKKSKKPCFIYTKYYRYLEHVGINDDFNAGYRSKNIFEKWQKKDPVALQRKKLLRCGCKEKKIKEIEEDINRQVENSIKLAKESPFAESNETYKDIFYEY